MRTRQVQMPEGYRCPFCPGHQDDVFLQNPLLPEPICNGCDAELYHFAQETNQRKDRVIDDVVRLTGRSWAACRVILLKDSLPYWEKVKENPELAARGMNPLWSRRRNILGIWRRVRHLRERQQEAEAAVAAEDYAKTRGVT